MGKPTFTSDAFEKTKSKDHPLTEKARSEELFDDVLYYDFCEMLYDNDDSRRPHYIQFWKKHKLTKGKEHLSWWCSAWLPQTKKVDKKEFKKIPQNPDVVLFNDNGDMRVFAKYVTSPKVMHELFLLTFSKGKQGKNLAKHAQNSEVDVEVRKAITSHLRRKWGNYLSTKRSRQSKSKPKKRKSDDEGYDSESTVEMSEEEEEESLSSSCASYPSSPSSVSSFSSPASPLASPSKKRKASLTEIPMQNLNISDAAAAVPVSNTIQTTPSQPSLTSTSDLSCPMLCDYAVSMDDFLEKDSCQNVFLVSSAQKYLRPATVHNIKTFDEGLGDASSYIPPIEPIFHISY